MGSTSNMGRPFEQVPQRWDKSVLTKARKNNMKKRALPTIRKSEIRAEEERVKTPLSLNVAHPKMARQATNRVGE